MTRLNDNLPLDDIVTVLESNLLESKKQSTLRQFFSLIKILYINRQMNLDKSYSKTIKSADIDSDISKLLIDYKDIDPMDYRIIKHYFSLGILGEITTKYDEPHYSELIVDSEKEDTVNTGLEFRLLGEKYTKKVIENRTPLESDSNNNRAINDLFMIYSYFSKRIISYIKPLQEEKPKESGSKNIFYALGNIYKDNSFFGRNILSFTYAFGNMLVLQPELLEPSVISAAYCAGLSSCFANAVFPIIFRGTDINDTLKHTPGLFTGFYLGISMFN